MPGRAKEVHHKDPGHNQGHAYHPRRGELLPKGQGCDHRGGHNAHRAPGGVGDAQVQAVQRLGEEEKADAIYRYLVYAITYGRKIVDQIQIPAVYEIFRIDRMVSNEAHYLIEFLRFGNTRDGILFGTVGPKNDVIVLLAPHFADRLRGENWVIYDEKRKKAVVHQAEQPWFMVQLDDDSWKERLEDSNDQNAFECLWKTYHEHIAIRERINPRCQMNHLPLRFRPYMTEFQVVAEHER